MSYPQEPRIHRMHREGLTLTVMDWGASLLSLQAALPGADHSRRELLLKLPTPADYALQHLHLNATLGRYAGPIAHSCFTLSGRNYCLHSGSAHCLHGGREGFDRRRFVYLDRSLTSCTLLLRSPDLDQGFPGNLELCVNYALQQRNTLTIRYFAKCDRPCFVNITNHACFNLNGSSSTILGHTLQLNASAILEVDAEQLPTGKLISLDDAPAFDFRSAKKVGLDFMNDELMIRTRGYEHTYLISGNLSEPCARLCGNDERVMLEMSTDYPCLQLDTCNRLHDGQELISADDGQILPNHAALCLMPGFYPDGMHLHEPLTPFITPACPLQQAISYQFTLI